MSKRYKVERYTLLPTRLFCVLNCLLACCLTICAQKRDVFTISSQNNIRTINVDKRIDANTDLHVFNDVERIYGLSVSMSIEQVKPDYIIRLILEDIKGEEYLIAESYGEISDISKERMIFDDYCEETSLLDGVVPRRIAVIVQNASIRLGEIKIERDSTLYSKTINEKSNYREDIHLRQVNEKVNKVNEYNKKHNMLWRAGVTSLAKLRYSDRKRAIGFDDNSSTYGFEYYIEGIFELGSTMATRDYSATSSPFVSSFSWCERHGKNWMTPVRDQYTTNTCYPFTVVGCVEGMTNLYYNQKIDLDLSEQELAYCSGLIAPYNGTLLSELYKPLVYFKEHGVCDEMAYPFDSTGVDWTCRSSQVIPNELIKIGDYVEVADRSEDSIKYALIHHGPLITGITTIHHSMLLVGYGTLQAGDSVYHYIDSNGNMDGRYVVQEDDPRIGQTVYIYKNSGGLSNINNRMGYYYFITPDFSSTSHATYYCTGPFTSQNYSDDDIVCEDLDNDGYYNWGIGPKPSHCPEGVPDEPDGDDSNPELGPMDEYGYLQTLVADDRDTIFIYSDQIISSKRNYVNHIVVGNNAIWTIRDSLSFYGGSSVTVRSGSTLTVENESLLDNVQLKLEPGSILNVSNNAVLHYRRETDFVVPVGAQLNLNYGCIEGS